MTLEPAVRQQVKLRMCLVGSSGAGKTAGALDVATAIGGRIAGFDTEHGRMKLFADRYTFDHAILSDATPEGYIRALREAEHGDYATVIFDSMSHEWLTILAEADKFSNWKDLTPRHNALLEAFAASPLNVIVTMRAKMKYDVREEPDTRPNRTGTRQVIERLGLGPIQRENVEYEFDILGYLDVETHEAQWANRCDPLLGTHSTPRDAAPIIVEWLANGDPVPEAEPEAVSKLIALLLEVGNSEERIESGFATARSKNLGRLSPEYVAEQTEKIEELIRKRATEEKQKEAAAT